MVLKEELKDFCIDTSIHGPKQIVNAQSSVLKRLWFAIFVGCLAYAGHQLVNSVTGNDIKLKKLDKNTINDKFKNAKGDTYVQGVLY